MFDASDLPEDPNEVWASVHVSLDKEDGETHTHEDGSEHTMYPAVLRIENHGFPNDKFIDAMLMSCISMLASQTDNVFTDLVPEPVREQMSRIMAREYIKQRLNSDDLPNSTLAFAIPTHVDFEQ